ncbi:NADPH-dependent FMN reductase [Variovorax paradoxus]|uniref:NADPH-dependent FMN reductase n=1 Tax=Variovorax paradoxus TaxID=34073 RepID=UPI00399B2296
MMTNSSPRILGIGGGTRPGSSAERYLQLALSAAEKAGATTSFLGASSLRLPLYEPSAAADVAAQQLVKELRRADGIIIASPGYHGTVSGFMKNALDYAEETRSDKRPYFSERAVGCMAVAGGWQAAVGTMASLREIVHALRGWPTPMGVAINIAEAPLDSEGICQSISVVQQIQLMASQVVEFANLSTSRQL